MIGYIKGILTDYTENSVIIEANGIGYEIYVSSMFFNEMPKISDIITIYTYLSVREDAMELFGFKQKEELRVFKLLITVSGIGPKGALAVLSSMPISDLVYNIITEKENALTKAQGIGKKTAARMILELKDKISTEDAVLISSEQNSKNDDSGVKQEAILALTSLGYARGNAVNAVYDCYEKEITTESLIRLALRKLSSK